MNTPTKSPRLSTQPTATRAALATVLAIAGCYDPHIEANLFNRPTRGRTVQVVVRNDETLSASATATTVMPGGDAGVTLTEQLTQEQLCSTTGVDCTVVGGTLTKICFLPNMSDQVRAVDNDGEENGVNYQICETNRRQPSWIGCEQVRRPSNTWICARQTN